MVLTAHSNRTQLGNLVVRALDLQLTVMSSNPCDMAIFRAEMRHRAKFRRTAADIWRFFKTAAAAILDFKILHFQRSDTPRRKNCVTRGVQTYGATDASCVMNILGGKKKFCDLLYCIVNSVMLVS